LRAKELAAAPERRNELPVSYGFLFLFRETRCRPWISASSTANLASRGAGPASLPADGEEGRTASRPVPVARVALRWQPGVFGEPGQECVSMFQMSGRGQPAGPVGARDESAALTYPPEDCLAPATPRPRAALCKLALIDYADHCIPMSYVVFRVCKRARQLCKLASSHRQWHRATDLCHLVFEPCRKFACASARPATAWPGAGNYSSTTSAAAAWFGRESVCLCIAACNAKHSCTISRCS